MDYINITRICIGTGMIFCVVDTIPTMLYGLDILYPKPYEPNIKDEILKFKHCLPYIFTCAYGCSIVGVGVYSILVNGKYDLFQLIQKKIQKKYKNVCISFINI
jgi:hypothetical protein